MSDRLWDEVEYVQPLDGNGGPPCFHFEEYGRFCGRAERWDGHHITEPSHRFVGLHDLILAARAEGARQERERIRGLASNDAICLAVSRFATRGTDAAWRSLLAAITERE